MTNKVICTVFDAVNLTQGDEPVVAVLEESTSSNGGQVSPLDARCILNMADTIKTVFPYKQFAESHGCAVLDVELAVRSMVFDFIEKFSEQLPGFSNTGDGGPKILDHFKIIRKQSNDINGVPNGVKALEMSVKRCANKAEDGAASSEEGNLNGETPKEESSKKGEMDEHSLEEGGFHDDVNPSGGIIESVELGDNENKEQLVEAAKEAPEEQKQDSKNEDEITDPVLPDILELSNQPQLLTPPPSTKRKRLSATEFNDLEKAGDSRQISPVLTRRLFDSPSPAKKLKRSSISCPEGRGKLSTTLWPQRPVYTRSFDPLLLKDKIAALLRIPRRTRQKFQDARGRWYYVGSEPEPVITGYCGLFGEMVASGLVRIKIDRYGRRKAVYKENPEGLEDDATDDENGFFAEDPCIEEPGDETEERKTMAAWLF